MQLRRIEYGGLSFYNFNNSKNNLSQIKIDFTIVKKKDGVNNTLFGSSLICMRVYHLPCDAWTGIRVALPLGQCQRGSGLVEARAVGRQPVHSMWLTQLASIQISRRLSDDVDCFMYGFSCDSHITAVPLIR